MTDQTQTTSAQPPTSNAYVILISMVATLGGFLFGFDSGVINGTVDGLQSAFQSDNLGTGFNVASMLLGCAAGAFFAGRLSDEYGRRTLLFVSAVLFIVSAWGSGIATGSTEFILYRIIGGVAVGAASVISPAYISEVAPAAIRGALISLQQIAIIVGLTIAFVSNYLLAELAGGSTAEFMLGYQTWRWMFWVEILPAAAFFLALLTIPESPRYMAIKERPERALETLKKLMDQTAASAKVSEIEASLAADHHQPSFRDLLTPGTRALRPIVWIGIGLAVLQQLVGINVVFYYGAVLWQSVGFSESDALMINIVSGSVSIIACLITIAVVDKIGRKPFLFWGGIGMAVMLGVIAVVFAGGALSDDGLKLSDTEGMTALIAANLYVFIFNMTWGPVMWIMLGEMFPNQIRGAGLAVAGLGQWTANFAITMTFPVLLSGLGLAGAYGIYATFALLSAVFIWRFVQETMGKELEDMEG